MTCWQSWVRAGLPVVVWSACAGPAAPVAPAPAPPADPPPPPPAAPVDPNRLPDFDRLTFGMDPAAAIPPLPGEPPIPLPPPEEDVHDAPIAYLVIEAPDRCHKFWLDARLEPSMGWEAVNSSLGRSFIAASCEGGACGVQTTCPAAAAPILARWAAAEPAP